MMGLLIAGGLSYALVPKAAEAQETTVNDVEAGRALFLIGCASCHGKNATGIETERGKNYGPSLIGVGAAAVDFQVGTGRMPMAQTAPQAPRKESEYSEEETRQLAAYVATLGPGPAIPGPEYTNIDKASIEDIREGGELFRANCTACHNSVGAGGAMPGGKYAPSLKGVSPTHIAAAMITGPQQMPVFSDEVITPEDKRNIIAFVKQVQGQPNYGGIGGGGLGPVVDGMFVWILGIGGLVVASIWIGAHGARVKKR